MTDWLPSRPFYRFGVALLRAETATGPVHDVLGDLLPGVADGRLRLRFPGGVVDPPVAGADRLAAVVAEFDRRFADFLAACDVRPDQVAECDLVAESGRNRPRYKVVVRDWRGWSLIVQIVLSSADEPTTPE